MALPDKADRWLPKRQAVVPAAVEGAGEPVLGSRLVVATGLPLWELNETLRPLVHARLLAETGAPTRYTLTAEGRARIAVWHAMRGDGQNRPAEGHDHHPPVDGKLCSASILALDAMGRAVTPALPGRVPNHDPRHRDRQWTPPDAGVIARIRDGLNAWAPEAGR